MGILCKYSEEETKKVLDSNANGNRLTDDGSILETTSNWR